jgi:hypothetical protein
VLTTPLFSVVGKLASAAVVNRSFHDPPNFDSDGDAPPQLLNPSAGIGVGLRSDSCSAISMTLFLIAPTSRRDQRKELVDRTPPPEDERVVGEESRGGRIMAASDVIL